MHPNSTPDNNDLPGVDDYQVTIPVYRDDATEGELRLRLPAASEKGALMLGGEVAKYLSTAIRNQDGHPQWAVAVDQVTAERVDTPSVDELAAELEHWKRIITALARKMPGMLQVTAAEYEAADTTDLAMLPAGDDAMMVLTPGFYRELADAMPSPDPVVVSPGLPAREEPLLLPAGAEQLPVQPGGPDPDVRQARVGRLGTFFGGTVEILMDGWWLPVENVATDDGQINLTLNLRNTTTRDGASVATYFDPTVLVTVRPATTLTGGYSLASHHTPAVVGQQLLHDGAWWTIRATDLDQGVDTYTVSLYHSDHGSAVTHIDQDARILIRRRRPGAWS